VSDSLEKQVSAEETFASDLTRHEALTAELSKLADRVGARLRNKQLMCSTVSVKIRKGDFSTHTRSRSFNPPTNETAALLRIARDPRCELANVLPFELFKFSMPIFVHALAQRRSKGDRNLDAAT
jgi:nucleotidyltransferase/DNA polymerase involved in DNA repair